MATIIHGRPEDQCLCSICLDVFTDPVSTSCGHNFCKKCITTHWDNSDQYLCPMCKTVFNPRPELHVNTFISEVVAQFRQKTEQEVNSSSSELPAAKAGEVPCDVCTDTKLKALKSCLVCLASYCNVHLQPHLSVSGMSRHQLINPVENLEDRMCRKHEKLLELFCNNDHTCVCMFCTVLDHKNHDVVPLKEEYERVKAELRRTEAEILQMIQERRLKIQEIQQSVELSKNAADRETAEAVEVFTALMESVQRSMKKLKEEIQEKQRTTEKQAEDLIKELEQEICELEKRSTEVEQLSGSEDQLHLVQTFTSVKSTPPMKTWEKVSICPPAYEDTVVKTVTQLEDELRKVMSPVKDKIRRVQKFEVDVTLDPDTAHPKLILSDDGKQAHYSERWRKLPDNPQRFSHAPCVLGKQSFSSGRFYFEVQVKGKIDWSLGVAKESINRKQPVTLEPENGYWTMALRNGDKYYGCGSSTVVLQLESGPQKVGVFVDYEEGLVSFYDVDTTDLIYSMTDCYFTEKLHPFFDVADSAPLIISPVRKTLCYS